jgi:signal peptidase II
MSLAMATRATAAPTRWRALARALGVIVLVIALDQLTKSLVFSGWPAHAHTDSVLPGVKLVHVENRGVAFGFFAGGGALVYALTAIALAALVAFLAIRPERPWLWLPTGMLLGGALGNLLDRLRLGAVRDFIKLPLWPAFNVADMSITFGVIVLLLVVEASRGERS